MAAGGGGGGEAARNDEEILEKIKEKFIEFEILEKDPKKANLFLTIQTPNKTYKTTFEIEKQGNSLSITNKCIIISYEDESFDSIIQANTKEPYCFTPQLVTDGVIKTLDLLSVLKNKLGIIYPTIGPDKIKLYDAAIIDKLYITPFRLLRGLKPLYQKYGFFNENIQEIHEKVNSMTAEDLKGIIYKGLNVKSKNKTFYEIISSFQEIKENEPLSEIMKKINTKKDKEYFLTDTLFPFISRKDIFNYKFIPESEEWNYWKNKILIIDFDFSMEQEGGKRKIRKSRKNKLNKKSRKMKGKNHKIKN